MRIEKILCPVDFSAAMSLGVKPAVSLARSFDAELIFFHVVDLPLTVTDIDDFGLDFQRLMEQVSTDADQHLARLIQTQVDKEVSARHVVQAGVPAAEIVELARTEHADLIVIPTHSRRGLEGLLLGSVAEKVVRLASCPVLTVHASSEDAGEFQPDKIMFATDFSDFADATLPYALSLAERYGADLLMVHVATVFEADPANPEWSFPEIPAEFADAAHTHAETKLNALGEAASPEGVEVSTRMLRGFDPAMRIVEAAAEEGAGLIVMATHGRTGLIHALIGSTAERVVRYARCPVLTVRPASD